MDQFDRQLEELKNDEQFTKVLEANPEALAFLVSFSLIRYREENWSNKDNFSPIDIRFDLAYSREGFYDSIYEDLCEKLGTKKIDDFRTIGDKTPPNDLIRAAFELGFIDQAMRCQEALRRAQQK